MVYKLIICVFLATILTTSSSSPIDDENQPLLPQENLPQPQTLPADEIAQPLPQPVQPLENAERSNLNPLPEGGEGPAPPALPAEEKSDLDTANSFGFYWRRPSYGGYGSGWRRGWGGSGWGGYGRGYGGYGGWGWGGVSYY